MIHPRAYTLTLFVVIILIAVFGLYIPAIGLMGHEMGCPFSLGETALCTAPLAHLSHWQGTFASILTELLALFALVVALFSFSNRSHEKDRERERFRFYIHIPPRPTLFQQLFAKGILNRKAP